MQLIWPWFLALLALAPILLAFYVWMLRRRRRYAVRYSSLALVREAVAPGAQWRRHLPFALFLLALIGLILAMARPVAVVQVPTNQTAILLAIDVSRSMCSTDIAPNRLIAAQAAALEFIERQPSETRIGLVAFGGFAQLIQPPTTDRAALAAAIERLSPARGTAIGSAILTALDAIAEENPEIAPLEFDGSGLAETTPAPAGEYAPELIVLLTDGVTTTGAPPLLAAGAAAERGVRIYTIGFGTASGSAINCSGSPFGGGPQFGGPQFGGGGGFRRGIDEVTLIEVADMTGGEYYAAASAGELQRVFEDLPIAYVTRPELTEVSALFVALGGLLAALAVALSLRWSPLP